MSVIRVTYHPPGGTETDFDMNLVLFATARFTMAVNGQPGEFYLQIKDLGHEYGFVVGTVIRLYIDDVIRFGGFLMQAMRTWPLPVLDTTTPQTTVRTWNLTGTDWNVLWNKRIVYDADHLAGLPPKGDPYKFYPIGTYDNTILDDILDNYSDVMEVLSGRAIDQVGIVILDIKNNSKSGGAPWNMGSLLREPFDACSRATGAIYYINAAGVLTYCDVDTADAAVGLSDTPANDPDTVGYRLMRIEELGDQLCNDALVWGAALGSSEIVFRRTQDQESIDTHGRWQKGLYSGGLYRPDSITLTANSMVYGTPSSLRGAKDNAVVFNCTVRGAPFNAGEKVECISNVFGFDTVLPLRKVTFTFPSPQDVLSELMLSYEIDTAWSIFEQKPPVFPKWKPPVIVVTPPPPGCGITDSFNRADGPMFDSAWDPIYPQALADCGLTWYSPETNNAVIASNLFSGIAPGGARLDGFITAPTFTLNLDIAGEHSVFLTGGPSPSHPSDYFNAIRLSWFDNIDLGYWVARLWLENANSTGSRSVTVQVPLADAGPHLSLIRAVDSVTVYYGNTMLTARFADGRGSGDNPEPLPDDALYTSCMIQGENMNDLDISGVNRCGLGTGPINNDAVTTDPVSHEITCRNMFNYMASSNLAIVLPTAYLAGSTRLTLNGVLYIPGVDYYETDPVGHPDGTPFGGTITLDHSPSASTTPPGDPYSVAITYIQNGPFEGSAVWP